MSVYNKKEDTFELDNFCYNYFQKRSIPVIEELTEEAIHVLEKLEIIIDEKIYTIAEYIELKKYIGIYEIDYEKTKNKKYIKPSKYGITKKEFDYISNTFNRIDQKYEKELSIVRRKIQFMDIVKKEKEHIRDKFIILLEKNVFNDVQKKKLTEFILGIDEISDVYKERFILYYGLQTQKYNMPEIAKLQNCTVTNIRYSINRVKTTILHLPNEKIEILRNIMNEIKVKVYYT